MTAPTFEIFLVIATHPRVQNLATQTVKFGVRAVTRLISKVTSSQTITLDFVPTQQAHDKLLLKIAFITRLVQANIALRDYCESKNFFETPFQPTEKKAIHIVDQYVEAKNRLNDLQYDYRRKVRILESNHKIYQLFCQVLLKNPREDGSFQESLDHLIELSISTL